MRTQPEQGPERGRSPNKGKIDPKRHAGHKLRTQAEDTANKGQSDPEMPASHKLRTHAEDTG